MYDHFYNLKAEPFRLSPDHRFCFNHQSYAKAKAYMQYAFQRAEGFVMVTGRPGTGKSTLVNDLVDTLSSTGAIVAKLVSTQLEAADLLRMVAHAFGQETETLDKATILQRLDKFLISRHSDGRRALLIIDEAQDLSSSALEELRLLTNLQLNSQPLLQIFLLGQEELRDLVQGPGMEQVHQRLVAACHLEQLKEDETKAYILHRLEQVGWQGDPAISNAIYPIIYRFSAGIPRRINQVCSRLFLHGSVEGSHQLSVQDVKVVITELQQEQLTFSDTTADINFDVADEYDDWVPKELAPASAVDPESEHITAPAEGENEAIPAETSFETGKAGLAVDVEEVIQPKDEITSNVLAMVSKFEPAAETDRSIRDQVILPPGRGNREVLKKQQAMPVVDYISQKTDANSEQEQKNCSEFPRIVETGLGDVLISDQKRAVKPKTNWVPLIVIALIIVTGLSIVSVYFTRSNTLEPQAETSQSFLPEKASNSVVSEPKEKDEVIQ